MTLTRLLGIKRDLLRYEDDKGLQLAERMWLERGEPSEPQALCDTLEAILDRCIEAGVQFAPILLKRKKQLERGTWKPHALAPETDSRIGPREEGSECPDCAGQGYVMISGAGHGSLCMRCLGTKKRSRGPLSPSSDGQA
jgi:hypothetical protein